jgi:hypothetical protein
MNVGVVAMLDLLAGKAFAAAINRRIALFDRDRKSVV